MTGLQLYRRHPEADAYSPDGGTVYTPYAYLATEKRFSTAELAAEWHKQDNHCGQRLEGYGVAHNGEPLSSEETEIERLRILYRFATLPHFDEAP